MNQLADLTNVQVIVLALFSVGADRKHAHLEDIAIAADKIRPGKYRWEKHSQYISDRIVLNSLSDATKEKNGGLVSGSVERGWLLTPDGVLFAAKHKKFLRKQNPSERRLSPDMKRWSKLEKQRLLGESAFKKFQIGQVEQITAAELESFFRLNEYITGQSRIEQVQQIQNLFVNDKELKMIVTNLGEKVLEVK